MLGLHNHPVNGEIRPFPGTWGTSFTPAHPLIAPTGDWDYD